MKCGRTEKALKCYVQRMNLNSLMQSHRQCFTATQLRRHFILLTWLGIFYKWTAHCDSLSVKELLPNNIGGGKSYFFRHPMHLSYVHYAHSKFLLGLQVQFFFFFRTVIHITHSPFCTCTDSVRLKSARFSKTMSLDTQGESNDLLLLHLLNSQQNQITEFEEEAFVAHAKTQACPEGNMMFPAGKGQLSNKERS